MAPKRKIAPVPFLKLHGFAFASLLVLHSSVVSAEKKHGIGIDIGVSNYTNRDDLASPLSYGGQEQTIGAFYDYRGAKNRHWVRAAYMTGRLKPLSSASSADHYYGLIQYGYARPFSGDSRAVMTFWFGGIWDNMISARDYSFGTSALGGIPIGTAASTLNMVLLCELLRSENRRAVFSLSVPFLGYLLRNGYAVNNFSSFSEAFLGGVITSLNSYQRIRFCAQYEHTLDGYWALRLAYRFIYHRYVQPLTTVSIFHVLRAGLSFQF